MSGERTIFIWRSTTKTGSLSQTPNTVTRFPSADPSKAEQIKVDYSPHAIAIDSQGNAWVVNSIGDPGTMETHLLKNKAASWIDSKMNSGSKGDQAIEDFIALVHVLNDYPNGSVSMIRPDGTQGPGSPFNGGHSIIGPWGITIDGNDHVWIANGFGKTVTELCGVRTDTCPPGSKTATQSPRLRLDMWEKVCSI